MGTAGGDGEGSMTSWPTIGFLVAVAGCGVIDASASAIFAGAFSVPCLRAEHQDQPVEALVALWRRRARRSEWCRGPRAPRPARRFRGPGGGGQRALNHNPARVRPAAGLVFAKSVFRHADC